MPELDTLRGIAVLMVVVFHGFGFLIGPYDLGQFHGLAKYFLAVTWLGWTGVNLFFVLSGFLITGILLEARGKPGFYSRFYFRRALRILPPYYLVLLALPLLSLIPNFPRHVGWPFVAYSFAYCANLVGYFGVPMQYGPLWSLAVEEHFYLFWPTVVKNVSRKWLVGIAIFIVLASPAIRLWTSGEAGVTWQNLDGLAMGAILAVAVRHLDRSVIGWASLACLVGAMAAFGAGVPFGIHKGSSVAGTAFRTTIIDVFFLGVLATFLLIGTSRFSGCVNFAGLRFFGFISYGLYLVHMLGFDAYDAVVGPAKLTVGALSMRFAVVLAATTLFCWFMRVTYEEWFLRLKDRRQKEEPARALEATA